MVTALYCCLAFLAFSIGSGVLVLVIDRVDQLFARWEKRKQSKRFDPMKLDERIAQLPDPVEQAYADTGIALADEQPVEHVPAGRQPGLLERIQIERLLLQIDTEVERYRRGEDITSGARREP